MRASKITVLAMCSLGASLASAQSLFSTGRHDSTILFDGDTNFQVQFSSANSVAHLVYDSPRNSVRLRPRWGFDLSAKSNGESAGLWENDTVGTTVSFRASLRMAGLLFHDFEVEPAGQAKTYDDLGLIVGVAQENSTLYDGSAGTFSSKHLTGWSAAVNYWAQPKQDIFFGARGGALRGSNVDSLTTRSFVQTESVGGATVQDTKDAVLKSDYGERTVYPIRFDALYEVSLGLAPGHAQTVGLDVFATKNAVDTAEWQPGVALLLMKPGKLDVLGGVSVIWKGGKSTVGLFVGYSF